MIDLHFHCLPGVDDGPADWQEAVALCLRAASEGTTTIVATPHVLRDGWVNSDAGARDQLVLKLNTFLGGRPAILAGCEYFFSSDAVELIEKGSGGPLTRLNRTRYLLLEFPPGPLPAGVEAAFHEFELLRVTPVLAHPERHLVFVREPERLEDLVARGALAQITAASLLGDFGEKPLAACEEFFRRGLVHLVASDAHSLARRPSRLEKSREWVRRAWGAAAEAGLFEQNPRAVIESRPLPWRMAAPERIREGRG